MNIQNEVMVFGGLLVSVAMAFGGVVVASSPGEPEAPPAIDAPEPAQSQADATETGAAAPEQGEETFVFDSEGDAVIALCQTIAEEVEPGLSVLGSSAVGLTAEQKVVNTNGTTIATLNVGKIKNIGIGVQATVQIKDKFGGYKDHTFQFGIGKGGLAVKGGIVDHRPWQGTMTSTSLGGQLVCADVLKEKSRAGRDELMEQ